MVHDGGLKVYVKIYPQRKFISLHSNKTVRIQKVRAMCFMGAPFIELSSSFSDWSWYKCLRCGRYFTRSVEDELSCPLCFSPLIETGFTA